MQDLRQLTFVGVQPTLTDVKANSRGSYQFDVVGIDGKEAHLISCWFLPFKPKYFASGIVKPLKNLKETDPRIQHAASAFESIYQEFSNKKYKGKRSTVIAKQFATAFIAKELADFQANHAIVGDISATIESALTGNKFRLKYNEAKEHFAYSIASMGNFFFKHNGIIPPAMYETYDLDIA